MIYKFKDFIIELVMKGTQYEALEGSKHKVHWLGKKVLSNQDMKIMCLNFFGKDYDLLIEPEKRKVREAIFKELRGVSNGKTTKKGN